MFLKDLNLRYVTFSSCYYFCTRSIHSVQRSFVPLLLEEERIKEFIERLSFTFSEKESYFKASYILRISLEILSKLSVVLGVGEV